MKYNLKKISLVFIAVVALISILCISAFASDVSVSFSDPSVTVGNSTTVSVSFSGDCAGYQATITYDSSLLSFTGASGDGAFSYSDNGGSVTILSYLNSGSGTMNAALSFDTKATGSASLSLAGCSVSDGNGDSMNITHYGSSTVTINEVPKKSSDATLSGLSIKDATLSPSFSSSTTSYSVNVLPTVTSLDITPVVNNSGASYSIKGNDNFKVGNNNVNVVVTAADGTTKTYTITVTRSSGTTNPLVEAGENTVTVKLEDGSEQTVMYNIYDDLVPKGFTKVVYTLNGEKIEALQYNEQSEYIIQLAPKEAEEGETSFAGGLYSLDANNIAHPLKYLSSPASFPLLLDISLATIPEGYKLGTMQIDEENWNVLVPTDTAATEHCLVYAMNSEGEPYLYTYDPSDGSFQRYGIVSATAVAEVPAEEPVVEEPTTEEPVSEIERFDSIFTTESGMWISIGLIIALIILAVIFVIYVITHKNSKKDAEESAEDTQVNNFEFTDYSVNPTAFPDFYRQKPVENVIEPEPVVEEAEVNTTDTVDEVPVEDSLDDTFLFDTVEESKPTASDELDLNSLKEILDIDLGDSISQEKKSLDNDDIDLENFNIDDWLK